MTPVPPEPPPQLEFKSLLVLVLGATFLFALILWPFFGALCWAVFIAIVFWPLHRRMVRNSHGRPNSAAFASIVLVLLIVILPVVLLANSVLRQAAALLLRLRSGEIQLAAYFQRLVDALPEWLRGLLVRFEVADLATLQERVLSGLGASGQQLTAHAFSIGANTLEFVLGLFVMLYVLFFMLRDGERLSARIAHAIPLRQEQTQRLLAHFATVVRATVKGNIVVAIVQGTLGGLAFWVLGLPGALLWGAVMTFLSLLPVVGPAVVWVPVALYLFSTGQVGKGAALALWGGLVIGLVDNFLRPILVGRDTRLPDYLVLVATLGGISVFGLNGFVIGPVIAAVFLVSWDMLATVRQENGASAPPAAAERQDGG